MEFHVSSDDLTGRTKALMLETTSFADEAFLTSFVDLLEKETLYQLVIVELNGERTKGVVWQATDD
jgi:hypothetical protein